MSWNVPASAHTAHRTPSSTQRPTTGAAAAPAANSGSTATASTDELTAAAQVVQADACRETLLLVGGYTKSTRSRTASVRSPSRTMSPCAIRSRGPALRPGRLATLPLSTVPLRLPTSL